MTGIAAFKTLGETFLNLIYPPSCAACGAATAQHHALCPQCWSKMGLIERPFCERLGTPLPVDYGQELLSPLAISDPPVFARARVVTRYDAIARPLVQRLKYGDRTEISVLLARMMLRAGVQLLKEADLLVPVPLHRSRLWGRRFNQASLLAREISRMSGIAHHPFILQRVKNTPSQVGLTRAQRRSNLQGAFKVPDGKRPFLEGKSVILIDDVMTTGSTANAASRALLKGGARQVDCLAFARVVLEE